MQIYTPVLAGIPQIRNNLPFSTPDMMTISVPIRTKVICVIQSCVIKRRIWKESQIKRQQHDFNIQKGKVLNIKVWEQSEETDKIVKVVGELTYNL